MWHANVVHTSSFFLYYTHTHLQTHKHICTHSTKICMHTCTHIHTNTHIIIHAHQKHAHTGYKRWQGTFSAKTLCDIQPFQHWCQHTLKLRKGTPIIPTKTAVKIYRQKACSRALTPGKPPWWEPWPAAWATTHGTGWWPEAAAGRFHQMAKGHPPGSFANNPAQAR